MLTDKQPGFCLEGRTKSKFFAQKLSDLGSELNKLMQFKRGTNGGIVVKYIVTVDGGLGGNPQLLGGFCDFAAKKKRFLRHFNRTTHVLKPYESPSC